MPAFAASVAVKPPGKDNMDRVSSHNAAIVLLRVTETIGGKKVIPTRTYDTNRLPRFYLASLDDVDAPKQVFPASLTRPAADDGWRYLVLEPGTYFLLILPPGVEQNPPAVAYATQLGRYGRLTEYKFDPGRGAYWSPDLRAYVFANPPPPDFHALSGFWFQVPPEREVVYLGSLSLTCRAGRGLFGSLLDSCDDFEIVDESRAASELASASLPGLDLDVQTLVPYGAMRPGTQLPGRDELPVASRGPSGVGAAFTGAELEPPGTITGVSQATNVFNLLVIGGHLLHQSYDEHKAQQRVVAMQPCVDRLARTVSEMDLSTAFASALAATLETTPPPVAGSPAATAVPQLSGNHRWIVSLPILRLRESGQPENLSLELGLDLRLEEIESGRVDGYALLLSGPELPRQNPHTPNSPLYSRLVPERARLRPRDEWCGPDGGQLLSAEIAMALQNIAVQVVRDLQGSRD